MRWVKVKVLPDGRAPERKSEGAAGLDCYVRQSVRVMPYATVKVPLGFAIALPEDHAGLIVLRSSVGLGGLLSAPGGVGVVDPGYTGEVCAIVQARGEAVVLRAGDRIAQMLIVPIRHAVLEVVAELPPTARGEGGFGSTGR